MNPPPRVRLSALPTPLQPAERLARALASPPIHVKRDDLVGFALAGNKARKLEFLLGDALRQGSDILVTGGGPGSNHCQAAAAASRVVGLDCRIVMYGEEPVRPPANLRLVRAFGADVQFTGDPDRGSVDPRLEETAAELIDDGRRPYVVPRGGATPVGSIGYAIAAGELETQLERGGVTPEVVVVATGSCGTQAGLVAGTVGAGRPWRVVGATVSRSVAECRERVLELARGCADLLGLPPAEDGDVEVRDARGPGYGVPSPEGVAAARSAADEEGLLLDGTFTAKAMGTLVALVREGLTGPVVFVHTGGTASILDGKGLE